MRLKISHTTKYNFTDPVIYALQQIRLTPHTQAGQIVNHWNTDISGGRKECDYRDHHKNLVILASLSEDITEMEIHSEGEIETTNMNGIYGEEYGVVPLWHYKHTTAFTHPNQEVEKIIQTLGDDFEDDLTRLHTLSNVIREKVTYQTGKTQSETTAEEALTIGYGVCQDHAHIFISAARKMGFPARYVSGYLMMNDRINQDATHAWAEAYIDNLGWVGFDVSNAISPDERYVRIATGLDYKDAAPVTGMSFGNSNETIHVQLQVQQ